MTDGKKRRMKALEEFDEIQPLNREQKRIISWLRRVRFKKKIFGGVSERDVWKKLEELNNMYNLALIAERARYDALLEEQWVDRRLDASIDTIPNAKEGGWS